jgi:hypothetical protein
MTDHREPDKESKKKRGLSRRAQLRRLHKALEDKQAVLELSLFQNGRLVGQINELQQRLTETQKLVPFWVRKFP